MFACLFNLDSTKSPIVPIIDTIAAIINQLVKEKFVEFKRLILIIYAAITNEINRGALLLVSDTPMIPEGIKTEEKDREVTRKYVDLHIDMGIEAMTKIGSEGEKIKHFKY